MSTSITFVEFRNANQQRNFPFLDDSLREDSSGRILPVNYFVDASLFPINCQGPVSFLRSEGDSVTISWGNSMLATGSLSGGLVELYDEYNRYVGILVVGEGVSSFGSFEFPKDVLVFDPIVVFSQNYPCVRGFRLPDGTIVSGDVVFHGENGLNVVSLVENGVPVVEFHATGSDSTLECLNLPPPVECIKIQQVGGDTPLRINRFNNVITMGTAYEMAELCDAINKGRNYPRDEKLPFKVPYCPDPPPKPPVPSPAPYVHDTAPCSNMTTNKGTYHILSANSGIMIETIEYDGTSVIVPGEDGEVATLPPKKAQGLRISLRGYARQ